MQNTPDLDLSVETPERLFEFYDALLRPRRNPFASLRMVLAVRAEAERRGLLEQLDRRPKVDPDAASRHEWILAGRPGRSFAQYQQQQGPGKDENAPPTMR